MASKSKKSRIAIAFGGVALSIASAIALADSSGNWTSGREVYQKVCGYCHEPNPGIAPSIQGTQPKEIREKVRQGHRAMPAFRHTEIDDKALAQLIDYLK